MGTSEKHPVTSLVILGANGQIGSFLYHYLKVHFPAMPIKACVRRIPANATTTDYTLFDPFTDDWHQLGKTDVIINCIGIIKENTHFSFEKAHVGITNCILQNRQNIGNPKVIQISALGANPDSKAAFLATKGEADRLLLAHPRTVVVRPSIVCTANTVFARKMKLLKRISRYLLHYLPFPEQLLVTRIQPVMPDDVAALVSKLCFTDQHPAIMYAVGPEEISLRKLIQYTHPSVSIIGIPQVLAHPFIQLLTASMPGFINRQQYELLRQHNVADRWPVEKILGRSLLSTIHFWQSQ